MNRPTLYLMIGFPGAGKTTVARKLAKATGAKHIWADVERHKLFSNPTHSKEESDELYNKLNAATEYLLKAGKSVIFDTNFNYRNDRLLLRGIAKKNGAETIVLWVTTPLDIAKKHAVGTHEQRNGYTLTMTDEQFGAIVSKLETPTKDEKVIKISDPKLDADELLALVSG